MDQIANHTHRKAAGSQHDHNMSATHGTQDRHAGHSVAMFRDRFWLSFALTIPVVFWSMDVQHWLGYIAPSFPCSKFIPAKPAINEDNRAEDKSLFAERGASLPITSRA